jgi:hypothetical protein
LTAGSVVALPGRSTSVGPAWPTAERSSPLTAFGAAAGFDIAGRLYANFRFGAEVDFGATRGVGLAGGFRLTGCFALAARLGTAAVSGATARLVAVAEIVAGFDFGDPPRWVAGRFEIRADKPARAALAFFLACLAAFRLAFANFRARLNAVLAARI